MTLLDVGGAAARLPPSMDAHMPWLAGSSGTTRDREAHRGGGGKVKPRGSAASATEPAWLADLRADARQLVGERFDATSKELMQYAEEEIRQFDEQQAQVTDRLEKDLRNFNDRANRLQEERAEMMDLIRSVQEQLESAETAAAAVAVGGGLPRPTMPPATAEAPALGEAAPRSGAADGFAAAMFSPLFAPPLRGTSAALGVADAAPPRSPMPPPPPPGLAAPPPGGGDARFGSPPGRGGKLGAGLPLMAPPHSRPASASADWSPPGSPPLRKEMAGSAALAEFLNLGASPRSGASPCAAAPAFTPAAVGVAEAAGARGLPAAVPGDEAQKRGHAELDDAIPDPRGSRAAKNDRIDDDDEELDAECQDRLTVLKAVPEAIRHAHAEAPDAHAAPLRPGDAPNDAEDDADRSAPAPRQLDARDADEVSDGAPVAIVICEGGGCLFGFTLRVAHGVDLGLGLEQCTVPASIGCGKESALLVTSVQPDGAIAAWNRQCISGKGAGKEVKEGDKIVAVNQISEAELMLQECREKRLLKFLVMRGEPDCPFPTGWGAPKADAAHHHQPHGPNGHFGALARQAMSQAVGSPPPPVTPDMFAAMAAMAGPFPLPPPPPLGATCGNGFAMPPPLPIAGFVGGSTVEGALKATLLGDGPRAAEPSVLAAASG
eukprot:CAMPEP_0176129012 /NCGR_PEP_ID=MMETSP0120_2-20121206/65214_1 /TAXON_ID=160619 /ORGANISM="Kryptoperidinium foliaceum, Strain CCMP 1326" /LENGTH=662 /DNA_ID=CAMNT_0017464161 /DNA_START=8 /DNA_END=1997 /DNA_ORIENTATION=-